MWGGCSGFRNCYIDLLIAWSVRFLVGTRLGVQARGYRNQQATHKTISLNLANFLVFIDLSFMLFKRVVLSY